MYGDAGAQYVDDIEQAVVLRGACRHGEPLIGAMDPRVLRGEGEGVTDGQSTECEEEKLLAQLIERHEESEGTIHSNVQQVAEPKGAALLRGLFN